jgi:hypothetical protein
MPLKKARSTSKKAVNKAVSANIHELTHPGTKKRSHKQIVAISINAAKKGKKK